MGEGIIRKAMAESKMKERIMLAAMAETNEKGIKFTMNDLASRLSVSKKTIYEYFNSKEELIGTMVDIALKEVQAEEEVIVNNKELDLVSKLSRLIKVYPKTFGPIHYRVFGDIRKHLPEEWEKIAKFNGERWLVIEDLLRKGVEDGCFRPINLSLFEYLIGISLGGVVNYNFLLQNNLTIMDALAHVADILVFGVVKNGDKQG